jgi:hypothetical protein
VAEGKRTRKNILYALQSKETLFPMNYFNNNIGECGKRRSYRIFKAFDALNHLEINPYTNVFSEAINRDLIYCKHKSTKRWRKLKRFMRKIDLFKNIS